MAGNTTDNLNLLKGIENAYFDYKLYLNDNWDKLDKSIGELLERDNNIYIGEKVIENATHFDLITDAINSAQLEEKSVFFPKGRYNLDQPLNISNLSIDIIFEEGAVIAGDVKISDSSNITFTNLTIEGSLTLDSIENCKFINAKIDGNTVITAQQGKSNTSNYFVNSIFNSNDKGLDFNCSDPLSTGDPVPVNTFINRNTFFNCQIKGGNFGLHAKIPDNIMYAEISDNMFMSCKMEITNLVGGNSSIYLGRKTKAFHFVNQNTNGHNAIDVSNSDGLHILMGGILGGEIIGFDKFMVYKPTSSTSISFERIGNNINNMRKLKAFNGEVPKWEKFNVEVENIYTDLETTGNGCLKINSPNNSSYPTLERTFTTDDHMNQAINVIARVKMSSTKYLADGALILTNGFGGDSVTVPLTPDDEWKVVTARIEATADRDVVVKLSPNNSYSSSVNTLFVDWIVITLGDSVQLSSIPPEEHHYGDLEHHGKLLVYGDMHTKGPIHIDDELSINGEITGTFNLTNGNLSVLRVQDSQNTDGVFIKIGNEIVDSADASTFKLFKLGVEGDKNNQILKLYSIDGQKNSSTYTEFPGEEILYIAKDAILYRGNEIHHNGNSGGSGNIRPQNPQTGRMFYDTNLKQPIWFDGNVWRDANKNQV